MGFTIQDILDNLNQIEVKGKNNVGLLHNSILMVEALMQALSNDAANKAAEVTEGGETDA